MIVNISTYLTFDHSRFLDIHVAKVYPTEGTIRVKDFHIQLATTEKISSSNLNKASEFCNALSGQIK